MYREAVRQVVERGRVVWQLRDDLAVLLDGGIPVACGFVLQGERHVPGCVGGREFRHALEGFAGARRVAAAEAHVGAGHPCCGLTVETRGCERLHTAVAQELR